MFDYYQTPPQEIFDDIKENAIKIWETYDNTFGYVDEKVSQVKGTDNFQDNAWFLVAMFDWQNQIRLLIMVKPETAKQIRLAISYEEKS